MQRTPVMQGNLQATMRATDNQVHRKEVKVHHTKMKADIGVAKALSDLTVKGYVPCIPLSEHQPYDIVAVSKRGKAYKLQVKYASLKPNGTIEVRFRSSWADRNGTHIRHYSVDDFDFYAIYCPEKDKVLYVPNSDKCPKVLRFEKAINHQNLHIKWANDYLKLE